MAEAELEPRLRELVEIAERVRDNAYARYSNFQVGAALRTLRGNIYSGCNVENASYGATLCAERSAIAAMVAAGEREIDAVAVFTNADPPSMPCGICRQVLLEFGGDRMLIVAASPRALSLTTLSDLLPQPFSLSR
jgi:cytidine deaminase